METYGSSQKLIRENKWRIRWNKRHASPEDLGLFLNKAAIGMGVQRTPGDKSIPCRAEQIFDYMHAGCRRLQWIFRNTENQQWFESPYAGWYCPRKELPCVNNLLHDAVFIPEIAAELPAGKEGVELQQEEKKLLDFYQSVFHQWKILHIVCLTYLAGWLRRRHWYDEPLMMLMRKLASAFTFTISVITNGVLPMNWTTVLRIYQYYQREPGVRVFFLYSILHSSTNNTRLVLPILKSDTHYCGKAFIVPGCSLTSSTEQPQDRCKNAQWRKRYYKEWQDRKQGCLKKLFS